ncbi:hypothetical protein AB205_0076890, partial [Aquarana catesbeiana]
MSEVYNHFNVFCYLFSLERQFRTNRIKESRVSSGEDGITSDSAEETAITPNHTPHPLRPADLSQRPCRNRKTSTVERPYACSECGKLCSNRTILQRHEKSHTGEKPFSCSICGKCFIQKSCVVRHQMSHTGEKPYSCPECGKGFLYNSQLQTHQKIHTGELHGLTRGISLTPVLNVVNVIPIKRVLQSMKRFTMGRSHIHVECGKCFIDRSSLAPESTHQLQRRGFKERAAGPRCDRQVKII